MSLINDLNWRYAVNSFSTATLTEKQLCGLIESVRLAPSAYGIQPYKLVVVSSKDVKRACLPFSYGQDKVANCSHLLVLAHNTEFTSQHTSEFIGQLAQNQNKSTEELAGYQQQIEFDLLSRTLEQRQHWAQQQCYIALGTLLTYAAANKIDACPMTGFDAKGINQVLGLSQKALSAAILCPVGFRSDTDLAALRPKNRLNTEQLVINI